MSPEENPYMRTVLSRTAAVLGGAALVALALPAGTAAAATSADCPAASSTRLLTGGVLGSPDNKLWLYSPSSTQTVLCYDFVTPTSSVRIASGAVVIGAGIGATPPSVTTGSNAAACTFEVVDLADPVSFRIALGAVGTTVCFTVNDETTSVTLNGAGVSGTPSAEVWRDGTNSFLDFALCSRHLAAYYTGNQVPYWDCANGTHRVV
jgi:hypothetical protein